MRQGVQIFWHTCTSLSLWTSGFWTRPYIAGGAQRERHHMVIGKGYKFSGIHVLHFHFGLQDSGLVNLKFGIYDPDFEFIKHDWQVSYEVSFAQIFNFDW
jgi:hypothetical protein